MAEKRLFSQNLYVLTAEQLGKVVQLLDQRCEACITKIDPADIEINIDAIDNSTFWTVSKFVSDCVPDKVKTSSKKRSAAGGGADGGAAAKRGKE